jgi:DNA-binding NtrC family response regulator
VIRLHLPPLRERHGDVQLLLDHFLNTLSAQLGKKTLTLSPKALKILLTYKYPGNVRELKNIVEYAINICSDQQIRSKHLPSYLLNPEPFDMSEAAQQTNVPQAPLSDETGFIRVEPDRNWSDTEKRMIMEALIRAGGRKNKAAASLGWARSTLWRKMNQYGIR